MFHKRRGPQCPGQRARRRMGVPMDEAENRRLFPCQWSTTRGIKQLGLQSNYYGSSQILSLTCRFYCTNLFRLTLHIVS